VPIQQGLNLAFECGIHGQPPCSPVLTTPPASSSRSANMPLFALDQIDLVVIDPRQSRLSRLRYSVRSSNCIQGPGSQPRPTLRFRARSASRPNNAASDASLASESLVD
jgi:hypothetical protein